MEQTSTEKTGLNRPKWKVLSFSDPKCQLQSTHVWQYRANEDRKMPGFPAGCSPVVATQAMDNTFKNGSVDADIQNLITILKPFLI